MKKILFLRSLLGKYRGTFLAGRHSFRVINIGGNYFIFSPQEFAIKHGIFSMLIIFSVCKGRYI